MSTTLSVCIPSAHLMSQHTYDHTSTVVEGYNGFHARFSKLPRENFNCDYNVQLSTAIQFFNCDSTFQQRFVISASKNSIAIFTASSTFNRNSVFQLSTAILTFNRDSTLQHSTAIATFNRDSFHFSTLSCDSNFQPRFGHVCNSNK